MKTIVEVNGINYGSTGRAMLNIAKEARAEGFQVYTFCRKSIAGLKHKHEGQFYIGTWLDRVISERLAYVFGLNGYFNIINTFLFLKKLDEINPDLLHIHSLCDNYLNIRMLFNYIKKKNIPVIWTLHDNWAFTGRCAQFRCEKWKTGCGNCPHLDYYPRSLFLDNTAKVWKIREKLYNDIDSLTIVTPSAWLAGLVHDSFLKDLHPVKVINNGIDMNIFKPIDTDFRKQYGIEEKFIILGLAYYWDEGKGLEVFKRLANELPSSYQIVMVGTNDEIDKELPENIISIHRTYNQEELVKIYTAADLFVNPTTDDNFPTVHMEAIACGLPVLTYNTGGCAEIIDETCGSYVAPGDYDSLKNKIIEIKENRPYTKQACIERSKRYVMTDKYKEYIKLYEELIQASKKIG